MRVRAYYRAGYKLLNQEQKDYIGNLRASRVKPAAGRQRRMNGAFT